jgi:hypothetical protein
VGKRHAHDAGLCPETMRSIKRLPPRAVAAVPLIKRSDGEDLSSGKKKWRIQPEVEPGGNAGCQQLGTSEGLDGHLVVCVASCWIPD